MTTSGSTPPRHTEPIGAWTTSELAAIDRADEIELSTRRRSDGTLRASRIVWVVRDGDSFYVRSVNGPAAAWYQQYTAAHTAAQVWPMTISDAAKDSPRSHLRRAGLHAVLLVR